MSRVSAIASLFLPLALSAAQLTMNSSTTSSGSSTPINVSFSGGGSQVSALQFDMSYDGAAISLNALAGASMRSAQKNVYYADLTSSSHRLLLAGLNQNLFSDGPIFTLFVNVPANITPGTYTISLTNIMGSDPNGAPVAFPDVSTDIRVADGVVTPLQSTGIVNAGSLQSAAVAPGELIALIGSSLGPATPQSLQLVNGNFVSTTLGSTQVKFDGTPAPLIYAGLNQVNAIVPYEVAGNPSTQMTIEQNGQTTVAAIPIPVADSVPSLFTQNATGTGQAAALNEDLSLNTPLNPAPAGTVVVLYMTGTGQADPLQITGRVNAPTDVGSSVLKVTATVAGQAADVLYSGPAPSLVAGATQVNIRVPASVSPSLAAPISITVGNASSQDDVVISVGPPKN